MDHSSFFLAPAEQHPVLKTAIGVTVEEAWSHVPPQSHTGCFMSDVDAYLMSLVAALPVLADRLVNGRHMTEYINEQMDRMEDETDFSDLEPLEPLCRKITSLQQFVSTITRATDSIKGKRIINSEEQPVNIAPSTGSSRQPPSIQSERQLSLRMTSPNMKSSRVTHSSAYASQSPLTGRRRSSSPDGDLMSKLSSRGKGQWTCPHAPNCKLGGVGANGSLIVFERNSTFKAHLQKHYRPFRCDKQGCTNKKGFARIDQLRRHQETCSHG